MFDANRLFWGGVMVAVWVVMLGLAACYHLARAVRLVVEGE